MLYHFPWKYLLLHHVLLSVATYSNNQVSSRLLVFCMWNSLWNFALYFPHVERALVFCVISFCVWNVLLYFVFYFLIVERSLVFWVVIFSVWNSLWEFVLNYFACQTCSGILFCIFSFVEFSGIVKLHVIFSLVWNLLWYIVFYFLRMEFILVFFGISFCMWDALWYILFCFFMYGMRSDILCYTFSCFSFNSVSLTALIPSSCSFLISYKLEQADIIRVAIFWRIKCTSVFRVICFRVWNALWCFVLYLAASGMWSNILCCIFCVWNARWYFVLYVSACGIHSDIVWYIFIACETHSGI